MKIKIKLTTVMFFLFLSIFNSQTSAQKFEITPFYGYQFNGKVVGYEGDLNIRDATAYGLLFDITLRPGMQLEFYFNRSDTRVDYIHFRGPTYKLIDASVNYFQIGGLKEVMRKKNITLYGISSLGAMLLSPSGSGYNETPELFYFEDKWFFSLTLGAGAKVWLSDRVGLRFEGRALMPITWGGGGFMVGTGGSGFYFGGGSAILQANLSAGLIIGLGK